MNPLATIQVALQYRHQYVCIRADHWIAATFLYYTLLVTYLICVCIPHANGVALYFS